MGWRQSLNTAGIVALAFCAGAPAAHAQQMNGPAKVAEVRKGPALVDPRGMTLYVFDEDRDGTPHCQKDCTTQWPPFAAKAEDKPSGDWATTPREDGSKQWTYKGRPLYTWYRDKKEGDAEGDGFNGNRWHIARP